VELEKRQALARLLDEALGGSYPCFVNLPVKYKVEESLWSIADELHSICESPEDAPKIMHLLVRRWLSKETNTSG